jgi:hypothetical protein
VSAMDCSSYSCASTIKDWGSPTHKTSTDSCSSCQLITKSDQKDNTDTAKPAVTAVTDDNWVQCCLYSSPPNYTDPLIAYAQDQASECPKKQQGATMIGTWWATNKDDCFFTMSTYEPNGAVAGNSTALAWIQALVGECVGVDVIVVEYIYIYIEIPRICNNNFCYPSQPPWAALFLNPFH